MSQIQRHQFSKLQAGFPSSLPLVTEPSGNGAVENCNTSESGHSHPVSSTNIARTLQLGIAEMVPNGERRGAVSFAQGRLSLVTQPAG